MKVLRRLNAIILVSMVMTLVASCFMAWIFAGNEVIKAETGDLDMIVIALYSLSLFVVLSNIIMSRLIRTSIILPVIELSKLSYRNMVAIRESNIGIKFQRESDKFGKTSYEDWNMDLLLHSVNEMAESARRRTEELFQFKHMVMNMADAIYLIDADTKEFVDVNAEACAMIGLTKEEFLRCKMYDIEPDLTPGLLEQRIRDVVDNPNLTSAVVSRHKRRDGTMIDVDIRYRAIRFNDRVTLVSAARDMTEQLEQQQKLRELTNHIQTISEATRAAAARDLHDVIGNSVTGIKISLEHLRSQMDAAGLLDESEIAARLLEECDTVAANIKNVVLGLRPVMLDTLGIVPTLEWLAMEFFKKYGIPVEFSEEGVGDLYENLIGLPQSTSITMFRIAQEALSNVAKHAHASHVALKIGLAGDDLVLEVSDNGKWQPEKSTSGFGLLSMSERAASINATIQVEHTGNPGTIVTLIIPNISDRIEFED